jgi:hypothetical protein
MRSTNIGYRGQRYRSVVFITVAFDVAAVARYAWPSTRRDLLQQPSDVVPGTSLRGAHPGAVQL